MGVPAVSVIIPTYNRREELRQTLEALAAQEFPAAEFEVIVADDGGVDVREPIDLRGPQKSEIDAPALQPVSENTNGPRPIPGGRCRPTFLRGLARHARWKERFVWLRGMFRVLGQSQMGTIPPGALGKSSVILGTMS